MNRICESHGYFCSMSVSNSIFSVILGSSIALGYGTTCMFNAAANVVGGTIAENAMKAAITCSQYFNSQKETLMLSSVQVGSTIMLLSMMVA